MVKKQQPAPSRRKSISRAPPGFNPEDEKEQLLGDIESRSFFKCPFRKELDESSKEAATSQQEFLRGPTQHLLPRSIKPPNSIQGHINDLKVLFIESSEDSVNNKTKQNISEHSSEIYSENFDNNPTAIKLKNSDKIRGMSDIESGGCLSCMTTIRDREKYEAKSPTD